MHVNDGIYILIFFIKSIVTLIEGDNTFLFFAIFVPVTKLEHMASLLLRGWNWCCRFRHRCGYGVHSPSDFFLITFVIYEQMPYYAYTVLHKERKARTAFPHYREKTDKLLFRLVNYLRPESIWEFGTGSGLEASYMAAARNVPLLTWSDGQKEPEVYSFLSDKPNIFYGTAWEEDIDKLLVGKECLELVHIAHTSSYREVFERLLPYAGKNTCFVVGRPYENKEKREWWRQVVADPRTGVTFDLYDIGLVFFDKKRIKEHRVVNFL